MFYFLFNIFRRQAQDTSSNRSNPTTLPTQSDYVYTDYKAMLERASQRKKNASKS